MVEGLKARWQIIALILCALGTGIWFALQPSPPVTPVASPAECSVKLSEGLKPVVEWSSFDGVVAIYRNGMWLTNAETNPFIDPTTPGGTFAYDVRGVDDSNSARCGQVVLQERFRCEVQAALPLTECEALVAILLDESHSYIRNRPDREPDADPCRWNAVQCEDRHVASLNIDNFGLESLPAEIGDLSRLRLLQARWNQFTTLPPEIGSLSQLEFLLLRGNTLAELPGAVGLLQELVELDLGENSFERFPSNILTLVELQNLDLDDNRLTEIPGDIAQLIHLRSLLLSSNELGELPSNIGTLLRLETLDVSHNQLRHLPAELSSLSQLIWLDASSNLLSELPDTELLALDTLRQVVLSYNQIGGAIPAEVLLIPKQLTLGLVGNELSGDIPVEILDSDVQVRIGVQAGCLTASVQEVADWLNRYSPGWQSGC